VEGPSGFDSTFFAYTKRADAERRLSEVFWWAILDLNQ